MMLFKKTLTIASGSGLDWNKSFWGLWVVRPQKKTLIQVLLYIYVYVMAACMVARIFSLPITVIGTRTVGGYGGSQAGDRILYF